MTVTSHADVARRLLANVDAGTSDQAEGQMKVPIATYRDPQRWEAEMEQVYRRSPLVVALSCDIRNPATSTCLEIADRPILVVRGDDGVARTFLNVCRHRGAQVAEGCGHTRRFTCPYHAWVYDTKGSIVGVPGRNTFGELDVSSLIELPTHERAGVVLAVLTPDLDFDPEEWLAGMDDALEMLRLDELHRYPVETVLESPNWKLTADGYVDGYHIGYLHSSTIGEKAITNRNTYDFFGPHVRIGFANKPIKQIRDRPEDEWPPMFEVMSMVHYVFPNMSISGQPDAAADGEPAPSRTHAGPLAHPAVPLLPPADRGRGGDRPGRDPTEALRPGDRRGGLRHRVQDQPGPLRDRRRPFPLRTQRGRQPEPPPMDRQDRR